MIGRTYALQSRGTSEKREEMDKDEMVQEVRNYLNDKLLKCDIKEEFLDSKAQSKRKRSVIRCICRNY